MSQYENIVVSLVKFINEWREDNAPDAKYVDFDAHAQISELPKDDVLIGPAGCAITEEGPGDTHIVFSFGVSTYQDQNLMALRKMIGKLYDDLPVEKRLAVYDEQSAVPVGWMVIRSPRAVTPVTNAEIRSVQFVELSALLGPAV